MTKTDIVTQHDHDHDHDQLIGSFIQSAEQLTLPTGFEQSDSWRRAQQSTSIVGSVNKLQWKIALPSLNDNPNDYGNEHRVSFFLNTDNDSILCECDCQSFQHRQYCAHTLYFWWNLCRSNIVVYDIDSRAYHQNPPENLTVAASGGNQ